MAGHDPAALKGTTGFERIALIADGVDALYASDEARRRFEVLARQLFIRFRALVIEPTAYAYAERHDNIEAIYKKLSERRDTADVTAVLKELHRIINAAIAAHEPGDDQAESLTFDLSTIDVEKLRDEFASKAKRKPTAIQDLRQLVEAALERMLAQNSKRMDYQVKYEEIVAAYNSDKDRTTIEKTFADLIDLLRTLDAEQRRAVEEGLTEDELALFDLLRKEELRKADREKVKLASRELLAAVRARLSELDRFWEKEQTKAEVEVLIMDEVYLRLPEPPFTRAEKELVSRAVYSHVWQQAVDGRMQKAA